MADTQKEDVAGGGEPEAVAKLRVTYGNDGGTREYRRCFDKLKKDLEKRYGEQIIVTGKKSADKKDCFDVAIRDEEEELKVFHTGMVDSQDKLRKICAEVEKRLGVESKEAAAQN